MAEGSVMKEFEDTVYKLQDWIIALAKENNVELDEVALIAIKSDPLMYGIELRDFFKKNAKAVAEKDVAALKALLPAQITGREIPEPVIEKGFLFLAVFQSLFKDLDAPAE
jgi:hypothetical protein